MATSSPRIVIAYDGSASAATAVRAAADLFGTAQAYVATVPQHTAVSVGTAMPMLPGVSPTTLQQTIEELEAEARREASETAQRAVHEARALGLQAEVAPVGPATPAWAALVDAALWDWLWRQRRGKPELAVNPPPTTQRAPSGQACCLRWAREII